MNLKDIRTKKGFTQEKLAKKLNIVRTTISSWELGRTEPDIKTLIEIAKILDVTIDELLGVAQLNKDNLSDIEVEMIELCRSIPKSKIKEGMNYIKYISNK